MSARAEGALVIDTSPLSHLAEAGRLNVLKWVAGERSVVIPDAVEFELQQGLHAHPHLQQVLDADWITTAPLISEAELVSFAWFAERLVVGTRNVGEAAVLAYADVHRAIAVVDDGAGRKAAHDRSVTLRPTLSLLCEAIRNGLLTVDDVSELADELLETKYRFPFARGGFEQWASIVGLI